MLILAIKVLKDLGHFRIFINSFRLTEVYEVYEKDEKVEELRALENDL